MELTYDDLQKGADVREVSIKPASRFFGATTKIRIGKKMVAFVSGRRSAFDEVEFHKATAEGREVLEVTGRASEPITVKKVCSLGHEHEEKQQSPVRCCYMQIPWEMVDQLIEWLQTGSWSEVRAKRKGEA